MTLRLFAVATAAIVVTGCGSSGSDAADAGQAGDFIAFASSFDNFHQWASAAATSTGDDAGDGLHGVGPLRVYWNPPPPHGSTSFPVGTIIVKETEEADVTQRTVFAMVKRGDDFNTGSGSATGWDWYSLTDNTDGSVSIDWSGVAPPPGQTYANQAIGDCNGCHTQASANDFVWDTALQLKNF